MTSYGLDEWFWAMFKLTWTWPNFTLGQRFMWIGANNDQIWLSIWARWVILNNVRTNLNFTYNLTFCQLFIWIGANNDEIWLPMGYIYIYEWFWAMFEPTWSSCLVRLGLILLWTGKKNDFCNPKSNLADIQSSWFWWYSFVFERTQSRLVLILNYLAPLR